MIEQPNLNPNRNPSLNRNYTHNYNNIHDRQARRSPETDLKEKDIISDKEPKATKLVKVNTLICFGLMEMEMDMDRWIDTCMQVLLPSFLPHPIPSPSCPRILETNKHDKKGCP